MHRHLLLLAPVFSRCINPVCAGFSYMSGGLKKKNNDLFCYAFSASSGWSMQPPGPRLALPAVSGLEGPAPLRDGARDAPLPAASPLLACPPPEDKAAFTAPGVPGTPQRARDAGARPAAPGGAEGPPPPPIPGPTPESGVAAGGR